MHLVINNQLGFTTRSKPPVRRSIRLTWQRPCRHRSSTSTATTLKPASVSAGSRLPSASNSTKTSLSTWSVIGCMVTTKVTTPATPSPSCTDRSSSTARSESSIPRPSSKRGDITIEQAEHALEDFSARLQAALDDTRAAAPPRIEHLPTPVIEPLQPLSQAESGFERSRLDLLAAMIHETPTSFQVHPKLARQLRQRAELYDSGEVEWALAEALAFASVLVEGSDVRLAGQDTRRGTFSQRHSVLFHYETGAEHTPLANLRPLNGGDASQAGPPGRFMVYDSLLSEFAALGFEYGYSVESPEAFVAWEAQFGDFANGAQIVIDNFLASAEEKWGQSSALTLLLPHGYEGQGPEHSSARLERFLTICADDNLTVAQPTTAAQYFHLLRAQAHRGTRRPLVVMTPKSLLRARQARSPVDELSSGAWREVLDDVSVNREDVRRVVLCSGKIAYDATARRDRILEAGGAPIAVARVEQLYPWPEQQISALLAGYPGTLKVVWLQEEPENMGAWNFVHGRLHRLAASRYQLRHVSRAQSGSPTTGSSAIHQLKHEDLLERSVGGVPA